MLLLGWLLPTIVKASNAWHEDKDCGCHNLNSAWGIRTMFERGYNASLKHRATDLKTLKEKSKQTKSEKKLKQALTYELWRSLRAYRTQQITTKEEAEAEVIKILKDPHRNILLVLNNRVYVHREFYERSKHPGHAVMVREACQLLGCPNVIYVMNQCPWQFEGAFTPSTRLVSIRRGRGWFLFRNRAVSHRVDASDLP